MHVSRSEKLLCCSFAIEAEVPWLARHDLHSQRDDVRDGERQITVAPGAGLNNIGEADAKGKQLLSIARAKLLRCQADLEEGAPEAVARSRVVPSHLSGSAPGSSTADDKIQIT